MSYVMGLLGGVVCIVNGLIWGDCAIYYRDRLMGVVAGIEIAVGIGLIVGW